MKSIMWIVPACCVASLLFAAACGGENSLPPSESGLSTLPVPAPQSSETPDRLLSPQVLPAIGSVEESLELLRGGSFTLADGYADGSAYNSVLPSQRISVAGSSAVFAPAWPPTGATGDKVAFGIYSFSLPTYFDTPVAIDFSWSDAPDAGLTYVGLANFNSNRWYWKEVPGSSHLTYGGFGNFIDSADSCLLAVVVLGTSAAILDSIQISTPQPPLASIVPDSDSGIAPLIVNFDGSASSDADGTITDYEWDLDGDGLFNESGPELTAKGTTSAAFNYAAPGTYNTQLRVTDNDGFQDNASAEINVAASQPPVAALSADFTSGNKPLNVTFNATASMDPDGTVTNYEWDFDGDGTYGEPGPEEDAVGDPTPLAYTYTEVGVFQAKVRVTDNDGGKDSETLPITVTNTPPVADLQANLTQGDAPFDVSFDASGSSDPGGTIMEFEWDFDNDGIFNEAGAEATAKSNPTPAPFTFSDPGIYSVSVKVTDDDDEQDTATLAITAHGWVFVIVHDPPEGNANQLQTALIDGKPAMAYKAGSSTFKYSRSTTALGLAPEDWQTVSVAFTGLANPGTTLCFADVNGSPAIAYPEGSGNEDLYYQVASGDGMDSGQWTLPLNLDNTGVGGYDPEIVVVAGSPAIAYSRDTGLYYTRASTAKGSLVGDWSTPINIQGAESGTASGCCFAIVNGNPAVAYFRFLSNNVTFEYVRSTSATGALATDWDGKVLISATVRPNKPAMYIAAGNPAISFLDSENNDWKYIRATSIDGATWGTVIDVGDGELSYLNTVSGTVVNGFPMSVAFHNDNFDLMFAESSTSTGAVDADWSAPLILDGQSNNSGASCEIIDVSGFPGIGYIESVFAGVKWAIRI